MFDAETGKLLRRFDNPGNKLYMQPHFCPRRSLCYYGIGRSRIKKHCEIIIGIGSHDHTIGNLWSENISAPADYKNYILFNSTRSGIDNIYAIDTITNNLYQLTKGNSSINLQFPGNTPLRSRIHTDGFALQSWLYKRTNGKDR